MSDARMLERRRFIVRTGVLAWGIPTAVVWTVAMCYLQQWWFPPVLAIALALFPIGGWFWGAIMWRWKERARK